MNIIIPNHRCCFEIYKKVDTCKKKSLEKVCVLPLNSIEKVECFGYKESGDSVRMMAMMRWKRAAALLLSMCMMLCLCACGGSNAETPATQSPQQSAKPSTPTFEVPEPPQTENPGAETLSPANHGDAQTLSLRML